MKTYFKLFPTSYVVNGSSRDALYKTHGTREFLILDKNLGQVVRLCQQGKSVMEIVDESSYERQELTRIFKELESKGFGKLYRQNFFIETYSPISPFTDMKLARDPPRISRVFIELNNECEKDCWFCGHLYSTETNRTFGCAGCNIWQDTGSKLEMGTLRATLKDLLHYKPSEIYLTGGDLSHDLPRLHGLTDILRKFSNVFLTVDSRNLNSKLSHFISNHDLGAVVQIVFSDCTLNHTSLGYTFPHKYLLVSEVEDYYKVKKFLKERSPCRWLQDYVCKNWGRLDSNPLSSKSEIMEGKLNLTPFSLTYGQRYNTCLGNTLVVAYNGDLLNCRFIRDSIIGNIRDMTIAQALRKNGDKLFWRYTKDNMDGCKDCEYRYLCHMCLALQRENSNICNYDIKTGKWLH